MESGDYQILDFFLAGRRFVVFAYRGQSDTVVQTLVFACCPLVFFCLFPRTIDLRFCDRIEGPAF